MPTHHDETLLERYQREHRDYERIAMSEYTKGKLIVRGGFSIYSEDGKTPVADTCLTNSVPDNDEANARRLVAAWNACDGVSTDNLENNLPVKELAHRYNAALAERDSILAVNAELLEALKTARDHIAMANPQTILALLDELQTLRSERTAWRVTAENAEKDAARYRWLAGRHWVEPETVFRLSLSGTEDSTSYMQELDAAIDAAMKDES